MNHEDETRLGVGIVGAGRVGVVMGAALRGAGHAVIGVSAGSQASRDRADAMLPEVPQLDVETIVERAELVLFTVPDDELPGLVAGLAKLGRFKPGQIVMHCAGRYGTEVLEPARAGGAIVLALHPSLTFTGTSMDLPRLRQATIAVTGAKTVLPIGQALVVEIGAEPIVVAQADRALYHAAITHAANHTSVVIAQALDILGQVGVEDPARVLHSLVDAAVSNTLQTGPRALTGPVSRGDVDTVAAHLQALDELAVTQGSTTIASTYRALARATVARALSNGTIGDETALRLTDLLE
ncbi:DUF2520 domain-containing protein [Brevibacterium sp. 50QC2O2]|jgi:predicted short-subunit dehydrogenase-like oxidoreductase (DUF2520 family)|uniref:Rossmann-like and DUF2520 domain-containing protein n=1 Tax=Brevibacterium TaxID=1696 RepID=UPI00211BF505|nr:MULTISPECIES: DUF2520 domain-containing protein [unclassified Brevibacterium]MCQ9368177.1 DUF2520 domain-containing protein [Brevibacterium sp. 91QC2O2]MCQ9385516.1 DUF2520 domain-containing protein [Brevibacterium sp. 68QC2CO]MCQ9387300.1 DUF2520 domain-containing protein [Brevibacterium sp. 50QC2O2]